MLIIQLFTLSSGDWILMTEVAILAPAFSDISLTLTKVVHRIIGTIIGAIIAMIIIGNIHDIWLLGLLYFIFTSAYLSFINIKNYAFVVTFMTVMVLLFIENSYPTLDPNTPLYRIQNIFIGCFLSLVASSIWIAFIRKKSNLP
jgi:uncharacterized membrane protein YccC